MKHCLLQNMKNRRLRRHNKCTGGVVFEFVSCTKVSKEWRRQGFRKKWWATIVVGFKDFLSVALK